MSCSILQARNCFSVVEGKLEGSRVIDVDFREPDSAGPRFVSVNARRTRGTIARLICEHRIAEVGAMRGFHSDGYHFDPDESITDRWSFTRS